MSKPLIALAGLLFLTGPLFAQEPPAAEPADVASVDAIVTALYDVISGPVGQARDWDRFRSLFAPEARLRAVSRTPDGLQHAVMSPDEYVQRASPGLVENGFFESEIGRTEERFGPVVHLFSAYESKRTLADPDPFARGINSIQLMNEGGRWWIVSILWTSERPDLPIPERYLGG